MDTDPREPHRSFTDLDTGLCSSEIVDGTVVLTTPTGASEAESHILTSQESLLASPEEQELPEFNTVEDLREWLGMDDTTPSEDLSPEEQMELLESGIPEFNWTEDFTQYLEL
jgi:hypothetical protein